MNKLKLKVRIRRLLEMEFQPGWCEGFFSDVNGNEITIIDKLPILIHDFDYNYDKLSLELKENEFEVLFECKVLEVIDNICKIDINPVTDEEDNHIFYVSRDLLI